MSNAVETDADLVTLESSVCVVAQFRDAVQLKWHKPGYLKEIPAGALIVYENKTAFDNRNATDPDKKQVPLESDAKLVELKLGQTKKDALIVVVPIVPAFKQSCNIEFFRDFSKSIVSDNRIEFQVPIPDTTVKRLFYP